MSASLPAGRDFEQRTFVLLVADAAIVRYVFCLFCLKDVSHRLLGEESSSAIKGREHSSIPAQKKGSSAESVGRKEQIERY